MNSQLLALRQLADAILTSTVRSPAGSPSAGRFLRSWARFPLDYAAGLEIASTPTKSFSNLLSLESDQAFSIRLDEIDRHSWCVSLEEKIFLGLAIQSLHAKRIFEIGTFVGSTTKYMAEAAGPDGRIYTLDLPPAEFNRSQNPGGFAGHDIGKAFRNSSVEQRITQLLGNSSTFDFSPFLKSIDLVFIDASHDYRQTVLDGQNALRIVRPGGTIIWHDFAPAWAGVVKAVREVTRGLPTVHVVGTTLAVVKIPAQ